MSRNGCKSGKEYCIKMTQNNDDALSFGYTFSQEQFRFLNDFGSIN